MTHVRALLVLAALAAGPGCDVFTGPETAVRVSGRVVDAATGAPIDGVWAFLYQQSHIVVPLGEVRTGPTGRFTVTYDLGESPASLRFAINRAEYYNPRYDTYSTTVQRGVTVDLGDIPLDVYDSP